MYWSVYSVLSHSFMTLWTVAYQVYLSMEFPRQGIFLTQGSNLHLLHCRWILTSEPPGKPSINSVYMSIPVSQFLAPTAAPYPCICSLCLCLLFFCSANWPLWWLSSKEFTCSAGEAGSILGSGRPPGRGNGNPLQYSCLGNPMDKEAWRATVHGVAKE